MGATKVSVSDTQLDELILKSDFPKLKVAEIMKSEQLPPGMVQERSQKAERTLANAPIWTYVSISALILQIILLFVTIKLVSGFYRDSNARQTVLPSPKTFKSTQVLPPTYRQQIQSTQAGKGAAPQVRTQFKGVVGDFNNNSLETLLGGSIQVIADGMSNKITEVSIDTQTKFGKTGGSLKVQYDFSENNSKPVTIRFNLPNLLISEKQKITFRLKLAEPEMLSPDIEWGFLDDKNVIHRTPKSSAYVFWKRYELPIAQPSNLNIPFNAVAVVMTLESNQRKINGTFFLDDLSIE